MFPVVLFGFCLLTQAYAAPLQRKMVDLTHVFNEASHKYPIFKNFNMTVVMNGTMESGLWLQSDEYTSTTHAGTHMDSPSHFTKGGLNIDQMPITSFIGPAAVIDITEEARQSADAVVTVDHLLQWESTTGHNLNGTIVLMRSGWGKRYRNHTAYLGTAENDVTKLHFPGFGAEASQWSVDNRKILGVGVDSLSFDTGTSALFPSHQILLGSGVFGLENVANLEEIPIYGAMLYVMPMKIEHASGAPTRIIATYPEIIFSSGS